MIILKFNYLFFNFKIRFIHQKSHYLFLFYFIAADLAAQAPQANINFNPPTGGSSSYGGSSYGGSQKGGYSRPAPRPAYQSSAKGYQSPAKGYQQRPQQQKQWTPSKPGKSYRQQQQQDSYSYNTQITHQARPSYGGKPAAPRQQQKPAYRPQQQKQQDWSQQQQQDDGSYDQSNDWEEPQQQEIRGPKQSVAYEVRAPTHKIVAKYN
jgi:hypothetical protein